MRWLALLLTAAVVAAPVETDTVTIEETPYVRLQSATWEVLIDPARGGQVVSFLNHERGLQMGNSGGRSAGLFSDHDLKQPHPGEFMNAPYEYRILEAASDGSGRVQLTRTATGGWRNESPPSLAGLVYSRTVSLHPEWPVLRCHIRIANPTTENRLIDYWLQNIARIGEPGEVNYYYRPTVTGLFVSTSDCALPDREFVSNPAAGWMAAINRDRQAGLVYLVDVNAVARFYNCNPAFTQEFMYQRLPLPPGTSWETTCTVRPFFGLDNIAHASPRLIAGLDVEQAADEVRLTHSVAAFADTLRDARLTTSLRDVQADFERTAPTIHLDDLGIDMRHVTVAFPYWAGGTKVVRVVIEHADGQESYEFPLNLLGDRGGDYRRTVPPRHLTIRKPADLGAVWTAARRNPAGVLQLGDSDTAGLWDWPAVATRLGRPCTVLHFTPQASWRDPAVDPFPVAHEDLFRYDVLVFADGDARAVRYYGADMVRGYVEQGGGVLFVGGYYCFGKGAFAGSPLADILPVDLLGPWDLRLARDPQPALTPAAAGWLRDHELAGWRVPWYHECRPHGGSTVHLTIDDGKPLLVTRPYGRGRVAALLATPHRDTEAAQTEFVRTSSWAPFAAALLDSLRITP